MLAVTLLVGGPVGEDSDEFRDWRDRLHGMMSLAEAGPDNPLNWTGKLRSSIEFMQEFPQHLADNPAEWVEMQRARLVRADALLSLGDRENAQDAIDEVIRTARGEAMEAELSGPGAELLEQRRAAFRSRRAARLSVRCSAQCRVLINERDAKHMTRLPTMASRSDVYRVTVVTGGDVWSERVILQEAGAQVTLYLDGHRVEPASAREGTGTPVPVRRPEGPEEGPELALTEVRVPERSAGHLTIAGASTMGIGVAGVAVGAGLVIAGLDVRPDDRTADQIERGVAPATDYRPPGYAFLGVGSSAVVSGLVMLVTDAVRTKRSQR